MINNAPMVRLGELITECDERNRDNTLTLENVRGISIEKKFIPTKANMEGVSLSPYKIVKKGWFCYVTVTSRNGEKISLALYNEQTPAIVSSSYVVFRSKDENVLLPEYLYLLFNRTEFDRYSRFNSWGSARETFDWAELCRVEIPLPGIETQRALVAVYNGLQKTIADNEALIRQMEEVCHAFVVDCKTKYPKVKLGEWIVQRREKNDDYSVPIRGVTRDGFIEPKQKDADLSMYNVFYRNDFVFNPARMEINSIALNTEFDKAICSSLYEVFYVVKTDKLLPEYLNLFLKRDEFARFCWYDAIGSARNYFRVANMQDIELPLPPIELQESIAEVTRCLQESKRIVQETQELMKNLCPALVQKAAHSA